MNASPKERQAFGNEFKNSTQRIGDAYKGYHEDFTADLKVAWKAHMERQEQMHKVFGKYFTVASAELGCNPKCVSEAISNKYKNFGEVMPKCGCGKGAWSVKTTKVNVLAATERVYGDLESLTAEDNIAIQGALTRLDM
jgi:hypothetical protein